MSLFTDYLDRLRAFSAPAKRFLLANVLVGLGSSLFWLFFNIYVLQLGHKQDFIGLLAAIPPLAVALFSVPAGALGDRVGYRRALLWGGILVALGMLGAVVFAQPFILIISMVLTGMGSALWQVVSAPFMVEESREHERTHLFSVQFALMTASGFFGSLLGGALAPLFAQVTGGVSQNALVYQLTLTVAVALALLGLFPLLGLPRMNLQHRERRSVRTKLDTPYALLLKLLLPNLLLGLGAGLFIPFLNIFFKLHFHVSDGTLGMLFAGGALAMALASLTAPLLAHRIGKVSAMVWTQALSIPFLVAMGVVPVLEVAVAGFLIRGALMPMSAPIYSLFLMDQVSPQDRATVNGWATLGWNFCFALSAWLSGYLQVSWGFPTIFVVVCLIYGTSIVLQRVFFTPLERARSVREPEPPPAQRFQC
ncbi:MFS transporter [Candidatus Acetothermia bacterium]|jgi:MFS family permease|nr:MFS transporter [Candidatus Acetothermia bacterium]MCI2432648.1 MFS transporter [Candidatus Acetothermia bacterium]MCI2435926.1 MFS transporter [Candidatus Acetothermia bacterium]